MRQSLTVFLFVVCFLCLPHLCLADGKMFSPLSATVDIPEQSAVIGFDGSSERLIVSTAFSGPQGEYAWVMPLPAVPKVERVTNGILPTLHSMCRPRIEFEPRISFYFIVLGASLWIAVFVRLKRGFVLGMLFFVFVLPWICMISMYSMGAAGASGRASGVSVQQRVRVGEYDVATVTARSAQTLLDWLKENGFKVGPAVAPALEDYIRDGWCFTVYRFTPEGSSARAHPLAFTFPAKAAVYPMRLTGVESKGMSLELFVLGEQEATVPGLECRRCGYLRAGARGASWYSLEEKDDSEISVFHAGVRAVVKPYKVMTALYGKLSPQQMARDYSIAWKTPAPFRTVLYTEEVADALSRWYGAVAFCALTLLAVLWIGWRTYARRVLAPIRVTWIIRAVGALAVVICLLLLPSIWLSHLPTAVMQGCLVLFLIIMWAAGWVPWRVKPVAFTPLYFLGVGMLSLSFFILRLEWGTHVPDRAVLYLMCSGFIAALVFVGSLGWTGAPSDRDLKFARVDFLLMLLAILAGVAAWSIAGVSLRARTAHTFVREREAQAHYWGLWDREEKARTGDYTFPTETAARDWLVQRVASLKLSAESNPFTGEPFREEDSPGNYQLVLENDRLVLYVYDANGGAEAEGSLRIQGAVPAAP